MAEYMRQVSGEQEMRYLLLEKDFEDRDALDLITAFHIFDFLRSPYAENVVKEIWRSPYATSDSIFSASTNFFLLFEYYDCIQDEEINQRLGRGKDVSSIQNHSMQFTVWRYSGKSRMIVEFLTTVLIATLVHVYLRAAIGKDENIVGLVTEIQGLERDYAAVATDDVAKKQQLEASLRESREAAKPDFRDFFGNMMSLVWLSFVCLFFGF